MPARLITAICLMAILSSVTFAAAPVVEPSSGTWSGKLKDESLRKLAPQSGFVADFETWKRLWTAWRPDEDVPQVNFSKQLILVGTVSGPNLVIMRPTINDEGKVSFKVGGTKIGGPGFGYQLVKITSEGVQSVNGKVVEDNPNDSITVTIVGTLRTGIVSIGGEAADTTITAKGVIWELDFGKNVEFRKTAKKLDGKKVVVQGSLERRWGVEIKQSWIVVAVTGLSGSAEAESDVGAD